MRKCLCFLLLLLLFASVAEAAGKLTEVRETEGQIRRISYVDENGQVRMNASKGYAVRVQTLDEAGRVIEERYLNAEGQPTARSTGQYGVRQEYDEVGRNHITTYLDAAGEPMRIRSGYAAIHRTYHEDGRLDVIWYYGTDGRPTSTGQGRYGTRTLYENGNKVGTTPVDRQGRPLFLLNRFLEKNQWAVAVAALALILLAMLLPRRACVLLLVCYAGFILYMTLLVRNGSSEQRVNLELLRSWRTLLTSGKIDRLMLDNVLLFVPFGALLARIDRRARALLWVLGLTVLIEAVQYVGGLGLCELDDILNNSLGGALGWVCVAATLWLWEKRRGACRREKMRE